MRLKCIGCEALARPIYLAAARSAHTVDLNILQIGLHNTPGGLRERLQAEIDLASDSGYDAVVLAYALCGKATAGIQARSIPIVLPKAHDCITLFLGSRERYDEQQKSCPGTYWYSQDYIERGKFSETPFTLGAPTNSDQDIELVYQGYVEKYGKDNADYLMEVMGGWLNHYQRAVYVDLGLGDGKAVEEQAREQADRRGWTFERMAGDLILINQLLSGEWNSNFMIANPGKKVRMTFDQDVIGPE
jgi:hypothetical protein